MLINKALIFKSTFVITIAIILSKILGLIKQQYSIYLFGGDWEFDSFIAAFRIPNALRELLAEGALSAAFIPIFSALLVKYGKKRAFNFANQILTLTFCLTLLISVISLFISNDFMKYYHYNSMHPEASILAQKLFDIMMFYLPCISLSALLMGILNSMNYFVISSLGPFFSNLAFLFVLYFFHNSLGITSLAYATITGGIIYFFIQIPVIKTTKFKFRFKIHLNNSDIKEFLTLFFPFSLAMGIPKLNHILSNIFADEITGANTALAQGFFIIQLPISIFVTGVSTISLPNMAKSFQNNNLQELKELILIGLRLVLIFTIPAAASLMILNTEIVSLIFNDFLLLFLHDNFSNSNIKVINNIAKAQFYFSPGIIAIGMSIILIRAFQGMKNMKYLIYTSIFSVILHFGLISLFISYLSYSFTFIAFSISITSFFTCTILLITLIKKLKGFIWKTNLISLYKILLSTSIMIIVILLLKQKFINMHFHNYIPLNNVLSTGIIIITGIIIYGTSLYLLKENEWKNIVKTLVKKIL